MAKGHSQFQQVIGAPASCETDGNSIPLRISASPDLEIPKACQSFHAREEVLEELDSNASHEL